MILADNNKDAKARFQIMILFVVVHLLVCWWRMQVSDIPNDLSYCHQNKDSVKEFSLKSHKTGFILDGLKIVLSK